MQIHIDVYNSIAPIPLPPPVSSAWLADCAVRALIEEAELTPKPALVDLRGNGAHDDLSFELLLRSAHALLPYFAAMATAAHQRPASIALRERLGLLGRQAERAMLQATGGVNTHRGAIWALGLLVAAASQGGERSAQGICERAARLASLPDANAGDPPTHGSCIAMRYGAGGARSEAAAGFPHVWAIGLAALRCGRGRGLAEAYARVDALLSIMSTLGDTCLLHRGGRKALEYAQRGAAEALDNGGSSTHEGMQALQRLHRGLMALWASPGGSADMLAATLLLDRIAVSRESCV